MFRKVKIALMVFLFASSVARHSVLEGTLNRLVEKLCDRATSHLVDVLWDYFDGARTIPNTRDTHCTMTSSCVTRGIGNCCCSLYHAVSVPISTCGLSLKLMHQPLGMGFGGISSGLGQIQHDTFYNSV